MRRFFNILDNSSNRSNVMIISQNTREDIIGELDAIIQYENHIEQTNDLLAKETLMDIVKEEKVHVGQLFGLLFMLDPQSKEMFEKGLKEFNDQNKKI